MHLLGGAGAMLLGAVCFDFLPPLGVVEVAAGAWVLMARSTTAAIAAAASTALILATAIQVMVAVSGPANPLMLSIAASSTLIAAGLIRAVMSGERRSGNPLCCRRPLGTPAADQTPAVVEP